MPHRYPILKNWSDNMTALSWIRKAASKSPMAKALQRILCLMKFNSPISLCGDFIAGVLNVDADLISRIYSNSNVPPTSESIIQKVPRIASYRRFLPSHELLLHLYSALSMEQNRGLPQIGHYRHFVPAKLIT